MAMTEFSAALKQVAIERGIPEESIVESIKVAVASAYRKDYGTDVENIVVDLDPKTGETIIRNLDDEDITPPGFGRIAAQTAKQVILQKIRETEKKVVLDEFKDKQGSIITGNIFRVEPNVIVIDFEKTQGILPKNEQMSTDEYRIGQRLKVLIKEVREGERGAEVIASRSDIEFVKKLFAQEVPEVEAGTVEIKAIAREAGSRTKIAVSSNDEKVDPVGSCVGQKGVRVQSIISELNGEKIDIILYSDDIDKFIAASLSPAKVTGVEVDYDEEEAKVSVPEDQLSLAIGKEGQNVRLAAKLTNWRIDIKGASGMFDEKGEFIGGDADEEVVVGVWDAAIKAARGPEEKEKEKEEQKLDDEKEDIQKVEEEENKEEVEEQVSEEKEEEAKKSEEKENEKKEE